jgi:hypothetical protein
MAMRAGSFVASVPVCGSAWCGTARLTSLYQLDDVLEGYRLVEAMPKGFTNQRVG